MSDLTKQGQYELEAKIHSYLPDPGVQAIREWLVSARDALNGLWPRLSGDKLLQSQGYAGTLNDLLRIIDSGPKLSRQEPTLNGGTQ